MNGIPCLNKDDDDDDDENFAFKETVFVTAEYVGISNGSL